MALLILTQKIEPITIETVILFSDYSVMYSIGFSILMSKLYWSGLQSGYGNRRLIYTSIYCSSYSLNDWLSDFPVVLKHHGLAKE